MTIEFAEPTATLAFIFEAASEVPWYVWAVLLGLLICWVTAKPLRHAWRIKKADWVLRRLRELSKSDGPAAQFGFLRSSAVDPYTFEEAILTALSHRKFKIQRNHRYSNDGGIDGKAMWNGKRIFIQAKKYSNHISPSHVDQFAALCQKHNVVGLFVHTGKTGPMSRSFRSKSLDIVSGDRLLQLLTGGDVILFPSGLNIDLKR
jgi:restriction system protein